MTVKLTCRFCGSTKNIPDRTCTWQCPSCSKQNFYTKNIEDRPVSYVPEIDVDYEDIDSEDNPISYEY